MAVRPGWVVWVARGSAAAWQRVACNPEALPPDRVLGLLCCAPLHLLARLAAFLCVPFLPGSARAPLRIRRSRRFLVLRPPELVPHPLTYSSNSSSSSSSSSSDEDDYGDDIHDHVG